MTVQSFAQVSRLGIASFSSGVHGLTQTVHALLWLAGMLLYSVVSRKKGVNMVE